jgi:hypothetical protein
MGGRDRDTPLLWQRRLRVGVMEHLERALALAYRELECLTGLGVGDRHRHVAVVLTPQQPDVDPSPVRRSSSRVIWVRGRVISLSSRVVRSPMH